MCLWPYLNSFFIDVQPGGATSVKGQSRLQAAALLSGQAVGGRNLAHRCNCW